VGDLKSVPRDWHQLAAEQWARGFQAERSTPPTIEIFLVGFRSKSQKVEIAAMTLKRPRNGQKSEPFHPACERIAIALKRENKHMNHYMKSYKSSIFSMSVIRVSESLGAKNPPWLVFQVSLVSHKEAKLDAQSY
jgi:hypothetical protein